MKYLLIPLIILLSPLFTLANEQSDYLFDRGFTSIQVEQVLSYTDDVRDADHFIKWFGAICDQEHLYHFVEGQNDRLCGRKDKDYVGASFDILLRERVGAYNTYWYKHETVEGRIYKSRYCTHENDGTERCPIRQKNVAQFVSEYKGESLDNPVVVQDSLPQELLPVGPAEPKVLEDGYKTGCRYVSNIASNQYIQVDSFIGKLIAMFIPKSDGKVFICNE